MNELIEEIKKLIIQSLNLEDISADEIDPEQPLFGDGLGLDSIDAMELGIALQKKFSITLKADSADTKKHFYSIKTLAEFITTQRAK